ncbi:MAG: hypothetical protein QG654_376 [Patescibacteria group bacterium]|nr:hypothetical protein [Patescibacteria group bacterium]
MMNKKMKKFIKILKSINLSQKEKDVLRYKIEQFISFNPIRNEIHIPKKSFYFSIFTFRALGKGVSLVLIALTVIGGTGVSYASTEALPGDKLYNVKINVNEKIEEKLAFTTEAKVVVQTQKVERRLTEAQKLVEKKDFSAEKKEIVKTNLEKNVNEVTKSIQDLKNEGKIEEALDTTSKITPVLEAHKKVLTEQKVKADIVAEADSAVSFKTMMVAEENDSLLDSVDAAIKKVEDAEKDVIEQVNEDQKTAEEVTERNTEEVSKKIESLKKENIEIDLKSKEETSEKELLEKSSLEVNTFTTDTLPETKVSTATSTESSLLPFGIIIQSETDAELKVKEAESLLIKAEEAKASGNFKEALLLSQEAKKIIGQIEEYKKIKSVEALEVNSLEVPTTKEGALEVEAKEIIPAEILPIDIKAEAIKSLEETNASLKKINLNQSTQSRLLP